MSTRRSVVKAALSRRCEAPDCRHLTTRVVSGLAMCCDVWPCAGWVMSLCNDHTAYANDSLARMTDVEWRDL